VNGVLVACLYLPNGNPRPGPKFEYKLAWFDRLIAHAADLKASGAPVILAGDYNVVPTEADIDQPHSWAGDALLHPQVRAAYQHARPGLERRPASDPPGRTALDVLGLSQEPVARRQGPAPGPSDADAGLRRSPGRRRRRSWVRGKARPAITHRPGFSLAP